MRLFLLLGMVALLAAGCGIKPGRVDPPSGPDNDPFPRIYPDLATDPAQGR